MVIIVKMISFSFHHKNNKINKNFRRIFFCRNKNLQWCEGFEAVESISGDSTNLIVTQITVKELE